MKHKVFIERCYDYDAEKIYQIIRTAVDKTAGIDVLKAAGKKVLIKPNILTAADPEEAVTTHPVFFEAVVRYFLENGFTVSAGDSPAVEKLSVCLKKNGYQDIMDKYGIKTADFINTVSIDNPDGVLVKRFTVVKAVQDNDLIINLPKLKTHSMMYHTGAMKNLFGLVKGLGKSKFHVRFPEKENFAGMINDLNILVKPVFSILDAVVSMDGHGPRNGRPYNTGFIAAGMNALAIDYASSSIIGYDPPELPVIKCALNRKNENWISDKNDIEYPGLRPEEISIAGFEKIEILSDSGFIKNMMPPGLYNFIRNFIIPKPLIDHEKCLRCRKCEEICAAGAAVFLKSENKIGIDYTKCITCYCCHEICPYGAITLKKVFRKVR
ncbi:MAG: DUF362 domain-containing protein [Spirochaetes bacterium]|nr:DUF362 domain-containing protein [Spirochaetota bacterium]